MLPNRILVLLSMLACGGCAYVPSFDVPTDNGEPTVASIVARVECELTQMVADDNHDVTSYHRNFLLEGNYDVEANLSVEVNDTGGLAPSLDVDRSFPPRRNLVDFRSDREPERLS